MSAWSRGAVRETHPRTKYYLFLSAWPRGEVSETHPRTKYYLWLVVVHSLMATEFLQFHVHQVASKRIVDLANTDTRLAWGDFVGQNKKFTWHATGDANHIIVSVFLRPRHGARCWFHVSGGQFVPLVSACLFLRGAPLDLRARQYSWELLHLEVHSIWESLPT